MKTYIQSTRNDQVCYTCFDGLEQATIETLMLEIGHIDIQSIDEETYNTAISLLP